METVLKTGAVVAGRYRVARLAWPTAIGPVWHAKDLVLDREVLLHSLAPDLAGSPHAREAFVACAAKAAQIGGANLAQVYDCGSDPPHLVTELPAGGRLAERLSDGKLSLADTARIVVGLVAAVRSLHENGTAHGAVAPSWIGIDAEGRPRLLGIGVADVAAIAQASHGERLDPPLVPAGYPSGADGDAQAADVRGIAAVALHALTAHAPGETVRSGSRSGIPQAVGLAMEKALSGRASLEELATAFAPYAAPAVPVEREPGFLRTEGKWLFAVLLFIGLGVAAVVAAFAVGKLRQPATPGASPPASASVGALIQVAAVHDFDPFGSDGAEHPAQTKRAIDGNPTTAWFTVQYKTADFGHDKKGVGLVFDLGSAVSVRRIVVRSPLTGWQGELRAADTDAAKPDDFRVLKTFTAEAESAVAIDGSKARYWLLWITRLTDNESNPSLPFQAAVAEVEFLR